MQKALPQLSQHALPCSPTQVHNYGGVLVEEDFSNYSVIVENPVHTVYRGKRCCLTHCHTTAVKSLLHLAGGDSVCNRICRKAHLGDSFCCLLSLMHLRRFRRFLALSNGPVFFLGSDPLCFDRVLLCKDATWSHIDTISRCSWTTHYCLHLKMTPKVDLQRRKACFMQKVFKMSYSYRNPCIHSPYSCNIANPFHLHSAILKSRNHSANQQELNFRCKETSLSGLPLCILKKQKDTTGIF